MKSIPKILCISANPAIDRRIVLRHFQMAEVNRANRVDPTAGGKAAHVAFAAKALGAHVRWLAFLGGPEGESCAQGIAARGITPVVIEVAGRTRTNLELIDESSGAITEVLEPGPEIQAAERAHFEKRFDEEIADGPLVVISGSLPQGLAASFYAGLIRRAKDAGTLVLLDASGEALRQSLSAAPELIKPNREEAGAILGGKIASLHDALEAAQQLRKLGPRVVILSLGAEGAVAVGEEFSLHAAAPQVNAVSTVGSGDSFLAGWAVAWARKLPVEECLRLATASGTANCLAASPGVISSARVTELAAQIKVEKIAG